MSIPTFEEDIKIKSNQRFDAWSGSYDTGFRDLFFSSCHKIISQIIELKDGDKLLDVGCGTGNLLFKLHKSSTKANLFGIDLSPRMVEIAQMKKGNIANISFSVASGDKLPYESQYFNYIICANSLHHHPDPRKSLIEMTRVLVPGGKLLILDGIEDGVVRKSIFNLANKLLREGKVQRYNKSQMLNLFSELGYKNITQQGFRFLNLITIGEKS